MYLVFIMVMLASAVIYRSRCEACFQGSFFQPPTQAHCGGNVYLLLRDTHVSYIFIVDDHLVGMIVIGREEK